MKRIFLVGQEGSIGKYLFSELKEHYHVLSISRSQLDITSTSDWMKYTNEKFDHVILLAGKGPRKNLITETPEGFEEVIKINLCGAFNCLKYMWPCINSGGSIILTSSIFGKRAGPGNSIAYQASKAGILALVRNTAVMLAPIRVNALVPGFVAGTDLAETLGNHKYVEENVPLKEMVSLKDIYNSIVYLMETNSVTGTELIIDGGWSAK